MKKLFFSALMLLSMSLAVNAQKISFDGTDALEFQFKRCFVKGSTCTVDFIVTNVGNQELTSTMFWFPDGCDGIKVFDDEGNVYDHTSISGNFGGTNFGPSIGNAYNVQIPGDVTLKIRCQIIDFDEYAALIRQLKISFRIRSTYSSLGCACLQVKDIPVTRE